jgi:hypothetical protein
MAEATALTPLKAIFRFPFQGPKWRERFLVGSALILAGSVVPIVPLIFVHGYALQIMRQAIRGQDPTAPAWDDWNKFGRDGLRGAVVSLVYLLPGLLVFLGGMAVYFASSFALPLMMGAAGRGRQEAMALTMVTVMFASFAIMMLSMFLGTLLSLVGMLPLPMATAHFIAQDRLAAAFHVREWWKFLRANRLGYFITWTVAYGVAGILMITLAVLYYSVILCCIIPFLTAPITFYLSLVSMALFGQTYRESVALSGASTTGNANTTLSRL